MVTILSPALTDENGIEQERCTSPLMCTEQAPHCATPQPYFVPVSPTISRITQSSGVSGSACTSRTLPLMLSLAMCVPHTCGAAIRRGPPFLRPEEQAAAVAPAWAQTSASAAGLAMRDWNGSSLLG